MAPVLQESSSFRPSLFASLFLLLLAPPSLLVCSFSLESSQFQFKGRTFRTWGAVNSLEKARPDAKIWVYSRANSSWLPVADLSSVLRDQDSDAEKRREKEREGAVQLSQAVSLVSPANLPGQSFGSLARFSDASLWVVGPSGSVYERFWNGAQWVLIPHDLPGGAGKASALASVNRTVLATSANGQVYHMYMSSQQQLVWRFCGPKNPGNPIEVLKEVFNQANTSKGHLVKGPGMPTGEGGTVFFSTNDGRLAELFSLWPQANWGYHASPRDADVQAIADAGLMRPGFVLTISSSGDLYELELGPAHVWRKHSRAGSELEDVPLLPGNGVVMKGAHGVSIFLPTADGRLAERRLSRNAWMWLLHSGPPGTRLSVSGRGSLVVPYQALMAQGGAPPTVSAHVADKTDAVLFATAEDGSVWEYEPKFSLPKLKNTKPRASNWRTTKKQEASASPGGDVDQGTWTPHSKPDIPIKAGVTGIELSRKRLVFMLEDGRLIERFLSGVQVNEGWPSDAFWIIVEVPESEGGNGKYCSKARGLFNCLDGVSGRLVKSLPQQQRQAVDTVKLTKRAPKERTDKITESEGLGLAESPSGFGQSSLDSGQAGTERDDSGRLGLSSDEQGQARFSIEEEEEEEDPTEEGATCSGLQVEGSETGASDSTRHSSEECDAGKSLASGNGGPEGYAGAGGITPPEGNWEESFVLRSVPSIGTTFVLNGDGRIAESLWSNGAWSWRVEEDSKVKTVAMAAAFNGSIFAVDDSGKLWLRERTSGGVAWQDVSPSGGVKLRGGFSVDWPPHDSEAKTQPEGALYFVSEAGSLMEFELNETGPQWHDLGQPGEGVSVAAIADVGKLRTRSAFCIGSDRQIYQFNLVVRKWSFFGQPSYIQLAPQPGATLRPLGTTRGSLFLRSENQGLLEIYWGGSAWTWNEHGQIPGRSLKITAPVGPAATLPGGWPSVLVVCSNGEVYERRNSEEGWSWVNHGYPNVSNLPGESGWLTSHQKKDSASFFKAPGTSLSRAKGASMRTCNSKVASARPLTRGTTSAVFLMRDGRLAEIRLELESWIWVSVVSTPFSTCSDVTLGKQ